MKVLLAGGTGFIGKNLVQLLTKNGIEVQVLRRKQSGKSESNPLVKYFQWNPSKGEIDLHAFSNIDAVINLAGEGIADKKWTSERKKAIVESRLKAVETLEKGILDSACKVKTFVGASAVGYYGSGISATIFSETNSASADFLGETCKKWENAYSSICNRGIRTCIIRIGIVLSKEGAAFHKMKMPVSLGLGSALGSGEQWMPWIHMTDVCGIIYHLLKNEKCSGVYNAVSEEHITNRDFLRRMAHQIKRPFFLPAVPEFILKLVFGEMSIIVLGGSRVSAEKIRKCGYTFEFPDIKTAFKNLC